MKTSPKLLTQTGKRLGIFSRINFLYKEPHEMKNLFILTMCSLLSCGIQAQVTIGSEHKPSAGALLDLKTELDGSSRLGLGIPRVNLTNQEPTSNTDLAKSIGSTGSYDMAEHMGLVVYNVMDIVFNPTNCTTTGVPVGLYVWDGSKWQAINGMDNAPLPPDVYRVTDSRDGEVYLARNFATAGDWMLENMRYVPKAADGFIHTAASSITAKHYAYPEGDKGTYIPANHPSSSWNIKKKNGLLYNWIAATNGQNTSTANQGQEQPNEGPAIPIQGICPTGWHVPSDRELNELEAVFAASTTEYTISAATPFTWETSYNTARAMRPNHGNIFGHGKSIKSPCPPLGSTTVTPLIGDSKRTVDGGFELLLAGNAGSNATAGYGDYGYMWTSSSYDRGYAWYRNVQKNLTGVNRNGYFRDYLFPVRCKKN